jgi:hypothetical protein
VQAPHKLGRERIGEPPVVERGDLNRNSPAQLIERRKLAPSLYRNDEKGTSSWVIRLLRN